MHLRSVLRAMAVFMVIPWMLSLAQHRTSSTSGSSAPADSAHSIRTSTPAAHSGSRIPDAPGMHTHPSVAPSHDMTSDVPFDAPPRSHAKDAAVRDWERLRDAELQRYAAKAAGAGTRVAIAARDYDVTWYGLDVRFRKSASTFSGSVRMAGRSLIPGLAQVVMNAASSLTIDSVTADGRRLTFQHAGELLTVTLPAPLDSDAPFTCTTYYSSPYAGSAVEVTQVNNVDLGVPTTSIATQSEPYDARTWWPCKDDPADKADSVDVTITIDSDLFPVSNGLLQSDVDNGNGTRTVHWKSRYPIVTYLVSVAAARYNTEETSFTHAGTTMPVISWWYGLPQSTMRTHNQTMLTGLGILSDMFITYPFIQEKYGMAEYEWGGAMEHQTVSSMGFYGQDVVIHELAHQWFGDKVTCATFEHIWLNEGWATYSEALYREALGGLPALKAKMATTAYYGPGKIFVDDPESKPMGVIFSGNLTYNKSSWVVHMLRGVVGDEAFFRATREYLGNTDRGAYRSVATDEFRAFFERASGLDLAPFFQQWIHGEYFPTYQFGWSSAPVTGGVEVTVDIRQLLIPERQIFTMPIELRFTVAGRDTSIRVWNSTETATYTFTFAERPTSAQLDPDNWILKRVVQPIVNPTFDKGILLVNGVDWDVEAYTSEISAAFADSTFTGTHPYTFWDLFPNPAAGYPSNVTTIAGSGAVPADVLGRYCTVVWIGNAYNGDEAAWQNTSMEEYIRAGGNVLLLTRLGRSFLTTSMLSQLGASWGQGAQVTIRNCVAEAPFLADMRLVGDQSLVAPLAATITRPENTLLFSETQSFPSRQTLGVWGKPVASGERESGHLVYLAMRPYRVERPDLKATMQALLDRIPCQAVSSVVPLPVSSASLDAGYPNPVTHGRRVVLPFTLRTAGATTIRVHDATGRLVRTLVNEPYAPGRHSASFDTADLPAGVYTVQLTHGAVSTARSILVLR